MSIQSDNRAEDTRNTENLLNKGKKAIEEKKYDQHTDADMDLAPVTVKETPKPEARTAYTLTDLNELKMSLNHQFEQMSRDITRLRQEGGATVNDYDDLQDRLTVIRTRVHAFGS